jgi:hypothetical protein
VAEVYILRCTNFERLQDAKVLSTFHPNHCDHGEIRALLSAAYQSDLFYRQVYLGGWKAQPLLQQLLLFRSGLLGLLEPGPAWNTDFLYSPLTYIEASSAV